MEIKTLIKGNGFAAVFLGTTVPITSLFEFLRDDQTLETFLDHFRSVARHQAVAVLNAAQNQLLDAPVDSLETKIDNSADPDDVSLKPSETPNLVCKYCKDPIYAADGHTYLHAYTGSAECTTPQIPTLHNRATPYNDNQTYPSYRAELIRDMTRVLHSYSDADSPAELLEILLADARHFADANHLDFDGHYRSSHQLYFQNKTDSRR